MLADRFGKKGVFTWDDFGNCAKYIIPCEYEKIEKNLNLFSEEENNSFVVKKAGFKGKINFNGEWVEHLNRD